MTNNIIKDLEADHQKILAFVNELEQRLIEFMEANIFDYEQMKRDILFIREFADKEHHQREEKILFRYMIEYLGKVAENLVRHGMIVNMILKVCMLNSGMKHFNVIIAIIC